MRPLLRACTFVLPCAVLGLASAPAPKPTVKQIYPVGPGEGVFAYSRISPDGRLLVYASETKRGGSAIAVDRTVTVVDLTTRKTIFSELGVDAYWSPDGRRMIYLSEKDGLARVSIRNLDGEIV